MVCQGPTHGLLFFCLPEPLVHLGVGVSATNKTTALFFTRWRQDEDEQRLRMLTFHLLRAINFDLEHDVGSARWFGRWRAVEVADELGPFQETTVIDTSLKFLSRDESIRIGRFPRTTIARSPRSRQPQSRITPNEGFNDRALAHPTRTGHDDDEAVAHVGPPIRCRISRREVGSKSPQWACSSTPT